jgi:hypothetical protein
MKTRTEKSIESIVPIKYTNQINMYRIEKVDTEEGFFSLREEWNNLLEKTKAPNIFLTWEVLYCVWKEYVSSHRDKLYILTARDNSGKLIGIAPFVLSQFRAFNTLSLPVREIKFLSAGAICNNYLDFLTIPGEDEILFKSFFEYLFSPAESKKWDIIDLTDLRDTSPSIDYLSSYASHRGLMVKKNPSFIHPFIPIPVSWEEYLQSLSTKTRRNVRYYTRKLEERFGCRYQLIEEGKNIEKIMNILVEWLRLRWEHTDDYWSNFRDFHLKLAHELAQKRRLQIDTLTIDKQFIAISYGFKYAKIKYGYAIAFDPKWSNYSPGTVLLGKIIKQAIAENLSEFDTLRLDKSHYKLKLSSQKEDISSLIIVKPNITGRMFFLYYLIEYNGLKFGKNILNENTKTYLQNLLQRIKEKKAAKIHEKGE